MKKILVAVLCLVLVASCIGIFAACNKKASGYEIAVVTDVGQLMDGGFNQGTWEGAKAYAEANGKTYKYYQPANGADATDNNRIEAMRLAIQNGAKVIVAPGFLQASAMRTVAMENPNVKFIFVDGWPLTDSVDENGNDNGNVLQNVTAVVYKEQESGYLAGYAAVKDGYRKLGGTFGGGGGNPACNRFAYGYVQGARDAAAELGVNVEIKVSFKYGSAFSASPELQAQIAGWYSAGTQVVFSCGGSMVNSVIAAANETQDGKVIGVDVDQAGLSQRVITSAVKGLSESVQLVLKKYYEGKWDAQLGGKASNLGAAEDATGLPTAQGSWRFTTFTLEQYNTLFNQIKNGTKTPLSNVPSDCNVASFWTALSTQYATVSLEA